MLVPAAAQFVLQTPEFILNQPPLNPLGIIWLTQLQSKLWIMNQKLIDFDPEFCQEHCRNFDGDGEDEYLRYFLFLFFLLPDRCRFFDFSDRLFVEGLLSSSVLLSFEDLLQIVGLFLLGCSFNGSPTLGGTSLLLRL